MLAAVTGGASMSFAGPFDTAVEGALVRNAWTSAGAWLGLRAADWAEAGIGGNDVTPYDVFVGAYKTNAKPDALVAGLGDTWSVTNGYHKVFACCGYAHSAIEATLEVLGRMQKKKEEIAEIVVETAPGGQALRNAEPETVLAAKFSMPHAIAATVQLGTAGARAFTQDKLEDAEIARLRKRVRLQPYSDIKPAPNDRPARVTMRFNDGAEMSAVVESARGGADKPFDEPTLLSKLAENAGAVFPKVPNTMTAVIRGDKDLLSQGWKETLAGMVKP
jgi:2-methylcitrate dehydratase PrpD